VRGLGLGYDVANRIVKITNGVDPSMSQEFGYDDESRLVSVYSDADVERYGYDADGNRLSQTINGTSATFSYSGSSNRLTGISVAVSMSYGYDAQGNTTTENGATTYGYDPFNRLSSAGSATDYVSPEGQRLRKQTSSGTTYFAPDANGPLLAEDDNGTWVDYVWLNGRLIGRIAGSMVDAIHTDQTGRPQVVTDSNQAVVWKATNYPFEREVVQDDIGGLNLGFPGQYYDAERGLWNNGYRDYNASLGRYVESDPTGLNGGINTYAYVGNDPVVEVDPLGLCPTCTELQKEAAQLADALDKDSKISGALAFVGALGTGISGVGEAETLGVDTPATVSLGAATRYFGTVTLLTHFSADSLRSFAAGGNTTALQGFAVSEIIGMSVGSLADHVPFVSRFSKNLEQLATKAAGIAMEAPEVCKSP
jgi:RHS repeat-associated protein